MTRGWGRNVDALALTRRSPDELRATQVKIAVMVLEDPAIKPDEREAVLREVLDRLGLYARVTPTTRRVYRSTCDTDVGTLRGYRRHLASYDTPCSECIRARLAELDARWKDLGIRDGEVVVPT